MNEYAFSDLTDRITISVINKEKSQEILTKVPHEEIADGLYAVAKIRLSDNADGLISTMIVTNELLGSIRLTGDEVLELGHKNMEHIGYQVTPLREMLMDLMLQSGIDKDYVQSIVGGPEEIPMYVITNSQRYDGASVLAIDSALQKARNEIGNFVIIPSSKHEIIAIPSSSIVEGDLERIGKIVHQVNADISPEEYLSDNVYEYDGQTLSVAREKEKNMSETVERDKTPYRRTI